MNLQGMFIREVAPVNPVYHRPYAIDSSATCSFSQLAEAVVESTEMGTNVSATALSGIAGKLLRPDGTPESVIQIPGGFTDRRWIFIMIIEVRGGGNSRNVIDTRYITGYFENFDDITASSTINPAARMYIDSSVIIESRLVNANTETGLGRIYRTKDSTSFIQSVPLGELPDTRYNIMTPKHMFLNFRDEPEFSKGKKTDFIDNTAKKYTAVQAVSKENSTPTGFMSRVTKAFLGSVEAGFDYNADNAMFKSNARAQLDEPNITQDLTFHDFKNNSALMETGYITFSEFMEVSGLHDDSDIWSRISITRIPAHAYIDHTQSSVENHGRDITSVIAYILANAIPELMLKCGYSTVTMFASNMTINSQFDLVIKQLNPMLKGMPIDNNLAYFKNNMINTILEDLVLNSQMVLTVNIHCNIYTEIELKIDIGDGFETFVYPTYCSGLYQSILTTDIDRIYGVAKDINLFCNEIKNYLPGKYEPVTTDTQLPMLNQLGNHRGELQTNIKSDLASSDFRFDDLFNSRRGM